MLISKPEWAGKPTAPRENLGLFASRVFLEVRVRRNEYARRAMVESYREELQHIISD